MRSAEMAQHRVPQVARVARGALRVRAAAHHGRGRLGSR